MYSQDTVNRIAEAYKAKIRQLTEKLRQKENENTWLRFELNQKSASGSKRSSTAPVSQQRVIDGVACYTQTNVAYMLGVSYDVFIAGMSEAGIFHCPGKRSWIPTTTLKGKTETFKMYYGRCYITEKGITHIKNAVKAGRIRFKK